MAIPMVVSGLMNRRALLQAELEYHERKVAFCKIAIGHFTATLDLYEETKDAKVIRRRYTSNNCAKIFAHGLVTNTVMDVLRNAEGPLHNDAWRIALENSQVPVRVIGLRRLTTQLEWRICAVFTLTKSVAVEVAYFHGEDAT
jgi:hypothetical protein